MIHKLKNERPDMDEGEIKGKLVAYCSDQVNMNRSTYMFMREMGRKRTTQLM